MDKWIIIIGNPVDGFQYVGPFDTSEDAFTHANNDGNIDEEWWVAELDHPNKEDGS